MNFKTGFIALALMGLATAGVVGCGGNDCEDAADRIAAKAEECGISTTDGGSSDGAEVECTDELGAQSQCIAGCYESASCEALKGEDLEGATALGECVLGC